MAVAKPLFSPLILDKLLVLAATHKMPVLLALNKMDAAVPEEAQALVQIYRQAGYRVFPVSAKTGAGIPELQAALAGKITAFGGPSGVGKSSLMNALDPELAQQTGALSEKISRGKHTTRFTTLVPFNGGYLADTPGFGNVFLEGVELGDLAGYFPEFAAYAQECKFTPCTHDHEKICGVKNAVAAGRIARSRYASYLALRQELTAAGERMYRK
jgi:ribosome biogenesis GTPase